MFSINVSGYCIFYLKSDLVNYVFVSILWHEQRRFFKNLCSWSSGGNCLQNNLFGFYKCTKTDEGNLRSCYPVQEWLINKDPFGKKTKSKACNLQGHNGTKGNF